MVNATGDSKVVDRGRGHEVYINTAGVGRTEHRLTVGLQQIQPGDAIVSSGDIGRYGIAVLAAREELGLKSPIESDCAPLTDDVPQLVEEGLQLNCLRDLTRGGLASALVELSDSAGRTMVLQEDRMPVNRSAHAAFEILGLSPLLIANEGRFVACRPSTTGR